MKNLANYTLEEFKEMFKTIPYDIIEIVYGYYHRNKNYTVAAFAHKQGISTATLYRYRQIIRQEYMRHWEVSFFLSNFLNLSHLAIWEFLRN